MEYAQECIQPGKPQVLRAGVSCGPEQGVCGMCERFPVFAGFPSGQESDRMLSPGWQDWRADCCSCWSRMSSDMRPSHLRREKTSNGESAPVCVVKPHLGQ